MCLPRAAEAVMQLHRLRLGMPRRDGGSGRNRMALHPDRLFPIEAEARAIARRLYAEVRALPILSPHGHTEPSWYADDAAFPDPAQLFVVPDHYIFRMLYSQGVPLERLGIPRSDGGAVETDGRLIWRLFAEH